uniref:Uncharacterized protein n=1 Tax=Cacopsylla melanoneura TaxID=428564 RepID=A0A8D8QVU5_9HEMI
MNLLQNKQYFTDRQFRLSYNFLPFLGVLQSRDELTYLIGRHRQLFIGFYNLVNHEFKAICYFKVFRGSNILFLDLISAIRSRRGGVSDTLSTILGREQGKLFFLNNRIVWICLISIIRDRGKRRGPGDRVFGVEIIFRDHWRG